MEALLQDVRYALRQMRKTKVFSLAVVAALALGLGANIAVFTVLSGILLRPLPYVQPERIVALTGNGTREFCCLSYANLLRLQDALDGKLQVGMTVRHSEASIAGPGGRFQVQHETITSRLLPLLGVNPILGRTFVQDENEPGQNHVAVLGEDVWRKLYLADPQIAGKTVSVQGETYEIVGVMPNGFSFPFGTQMSIWTPEPLAAASRIALSGKGSCLRYCLRAPSGWNVSHAACSQSEPGSGRNCKGCAGWKSAHAHQHFHLPEHAQSGCA